MESTGKRGALIFKINFQVASKSDTRVSPGNMSTANGQQQQQQQQRNVEDFTTHVFGGKKNSIPKIQFPRRRAELVFVSAIALQPAAELPTGPGIIKYFGGPAASAAEFASRLIKFSF